MSNNAENHKGDCCPPYLCVPIPLCDDRLRLRLAGLTGNIAFQLFRLKGCKLEIEMDCAGKKEKIMGIICNVGTDFVEILQDGQKISTVLISRILRIDRIDPDCKPCEPGPCPPNTCSNCTC